MTEIETVEKWFKKAGNDLNIAQRIFQDRHEDELDIVCFHCQQAAENIEIVEKSSHLEKNKQPIKNYIYVYTGNYSSAKAICSA